MWEVTFVLGVNNQSKIFLSRKKELSSIHVHRAGKVEVYWLS
jgi:hypothetical protein